VHTLSTGYSSVSSVRTSTVAELGVSADVQHLWSQPNVLLRNNALVHGNLLTEGTASLQSGAAVLGTRLENTELDPIQHQGWTVTFPSMNQGPLNLEPGQVRTIAAGNFAGGNLKTGSVLTLSTPGRYTLNGSLTLEPGSTLDVNNTQGAVEIYVRNGFTFRGTISPRNPSTANVLVGVGGTTPVPVEAPWKGILVAPYAAVTLATASAGHRGSVYAKSILVGPNTIFTHDPLDPTNFCEPQAACDGLCQCPPGSACDAGGDCSGGAECCDGVCGGSSCACTSSGQCAEGFFCGSGTCQACQDPNDPGCTPSHCSNEVQDQGETGVDCGGECQGCPPGGPCTTVGDCADGLACEDGECACTCEGKGCGWDDGCGNACQCPPGTEGCQENSHCVDGIVCEDGTCVPPTCLFNPRILGCGFPGAKCPDCTPNPTCTEDADCPEGHVCPLGNGWRFGVPGQNVCEKPNDPEAGCGGPLDPHGVCARTPACGGKQCGDADLSDGNGGRCTRLCDDDDVGCELDVDCQEGFVCRGQKCRPMDPCLNPVPPECGAQDSLCGACPDAPPEDPRDCGIVPGTGVDLGPCPSGQRCTSAGTCTPISEEPPIEVPTPGPGRPVEPVPSPPAVAIGPLQGAFSVTESGSARYAIPITVPPGRGGIEPALSLLYTSSTGNGALGVGWALDGLSTISRCARTYAQDGGARAVRGDDSDAFCLDGQRLVRDLYEGVYHTAVDTFARIVPEPLTAVQPTSWRVFTKDGRILTYGGSPNARGALRTSVTTESTIGTWALDRVEDRSGNFMRIVYLQNMALAAQGDASSTSELLPDVITYTGHGNVDGDREVHFDWATRDDILRGWKHGGGATSRTLRLDRIVVRAQDQPFRRYQLAYETQSNVSRVTSISECFGAADACKPATTFSYHDQVGFEDLTTDPVLDAAAEDHPEALSRFGMTHRWVPDHGSFGFRERDKLSTASVVTHPTRINQDFKTAAFVMSLVPTWGPYAAAIISMAGSLMHYTESVYTAYDHFVPNGINTIGSRPCGGSMPAWHSIRQPDGMERLHAVCYDAKEGVNVGRKEGCISYGFRGCTQEGEMDDIRTVYYYPRTWFFDANGDGVQDKFFCSSDETKVLYTLAKPAETGSTEVPVNAGEGTEDGEVEAFGDICRITCTPTKSNNSGTCTADQPFSAVMDIDGDGAGNLIAYDRELGWRALGYENGDAVWHASWLRDISIEPNERSAVFTMDANGDGLTDLVALPVRSVPDAGPATVVWNTGNGFIQQYPTPGSVFAPELPAFVVDYNHDGVEELFYPTGPQPQSFDGVAPWKTISISSDGRFVVADTDFVEFPGVVGDFNGDGAVDVLASWDTDSSDVLHFGYGVRYAKGAHHNLLKAVTDGAGRRVDIRYDEEGPTLTSPDPDQVGCLWPVRCEFGAEHPIVTSHDESHYLDQARTRSAADNSFHYAYSNAVGDMAGYGSLGFYKRQVTVRDSFTNLIKTVHTQYQLPQPTPDGAGYVYLFAGLPETVEETLPAVGSAITFEEETLVTTTFPHWEMGVSPKGRPFPYLQNRTVTSRIQLTGRDSTLHSTQSTFAVNAYGNVTNEVTTRGDYNNASGGFVDGSEITTVVERDFSSKNDHLNNWLIGLPVFERVTQTPRCSSENECTALTKTRRVDYEYDSLGRLKFINRELGGDAALARTTELVPDDFGNVILSIARDDTLGTTRSSAITYDARGLYPISFTKIGAGRALTTEVRYDDRAGKPTVMVDPNGIDQTWSYDDLQVLRHHFGPDGVQTFDYEAADYHVIVHPGDPGGTFEIPAAYRTRASQVGGGQTELEFDALGLMVQRKVLGLNGTPVFEQFGYDERHRLSVAYRPHLETDLTQGIIQYDYDALDRLIGEHYPGNSQVNAHVFHQHAFSGNLTLTGGELGQLPWSAGATTFVRTVDAELNESLHATDRDGRLVFAKDALQMRDGLTGGTAYRYGAFGALSQIRQIGGSPIDIDTDAYGRVTRVHDLSRGWLPEVTAYDALDQVTLTELGIGRLKSFFYDDFGRLDHVEDNDGVTEWIYGDGTEPNSLGRLVETVSPTGQRTLYGYEPPEQDRNRGLLTRVTQKLQGSGTGIGSGDPRTLVTDYTFDGSSRLERIEYPVGAGGSRVAVQYGFDAYGHTIRASNASDTTDVYWELLEAHQGLRIAKERVGRAPCGSVNGVTTTRTYEQQTGLLSAVDTTCGDAVLQDLDYAYDLNGRLTARGDNVGSISETFGYDPTGRLTTRNGEVEQEYDAMTGRLTRQAGVGDYLYESAGNNWIQSAGLDLNYQHDAIGNVDFRSGDRVAGGQQIIDYTTFDLPSRIVTGTDSSETTTEFAYNASGSRVIKQSEAAADFYAGELYLRGEQQGGATLHRAMIYAGGRAVAQIAQLDQGGGQVGAPVTRFLHDEALGSVQTITRSDGTAEEARYHHPFGPRVNNGTPAGVAYGFTGHEEDTDLGLINMRGRMYDSQLGQFLTPDPIVAEPHGTGLNRFAYAKNDPLNFVDPTGLTAVTTHGACYWPGCSPEVNAAYAGGAALIGGAIVGAVYGSAASGASGAAAAGAVAGGGGAVPGAAPLITGADLLLTELPPQTCRRSPPHRIT